MKFKCIFCLKKNGIQIKKDEYKETHFKSQGWGDPISLKKKIVLVDT